MNTRLNIALAVVLLASLACTIPFVSGVRGSGDLVTVDERVSGFDSLNISTSFEVDIIQSQTYSLVVRVDDNIEQYLVIDQRGDTLFLGLEEGRTYTNVALEAQISMPSLRNLELSGASKANFTQFVSSDPFEVAASGASDVRGDIEAGDVTIDLSGASDLRLSGAGRDLVLDASGSSKVDLEQFPVNDARLDLSGSSEAIVNVSGVLNVSASGASDVTFVGEPQLGDVETSGASSIQRK